MIIKAGISLGVFLTACVGATEPQYHCESAKRSEYRALFAGEITTSWLMGDVWRIDPVTTIYFNADCSVTQR